MELSYHARNHLFVLKMTSFKFYFWFAVFVESFPIVPIFLAFKKWKVLPVIIKFFIGFLAADLLLNLVGDYFYYLQRHNLFLNYLYSLFQSVFILLAFWSFVKRKAEQLLILSLLLLNIVLLIIDFLFISKIGSNYISGFYINLVICFVSVYYFFKGFVNTKYQKKIPNDFFLTLSLILALQFFIKTIDIFLGKYLMETQVNAFLWMQVRNVYSYFMLFSLIIYTYVLYNFRTNET